MRSDKKIRKKRSKDGMDEHMTKEIIKFLQPLNKVYLIKCEYVADYVEDYTDSLKSNRAYWSYDSAVKYLRKEFNKNLTKNSSKLNMDAEYIEEVMELFDEHFESCNESCEIFFDPRFEFGVYDEKDYHYWLCVQVVNIHE